MSRRYRRSRREPGLIEIVATSDWKVAAGMSAGSKWHLSSQETDAFSVAASVSPQVTLLNGDEVDQVAPVQCCLK